MTATNLANIAEEHARLMQEISQYDHVPADLRDTDDLLNSLEAALAEKEKLMEQLIAKRKAEHKDFDKLSRSATKRFFVRVKSGGKEGLERRLEKEEREYIEAAQAEHNESIVLADLKLAAENARTKKAELEKHIADRKNMLKRMSELYESAFDGPSPDFPEEDSMEEEVREAEILFEQTQMKLTHEKNVFSTLDRAASCANRSLEALQSANRSATYDTFGVGGLWVEMAERDDLLRAQSFAMQAQHHIERARGLEPSVRPISCGKIVGPDWLNVVFDNLYTDYVFQQKIKQSLGTVRVFQEAVFSECAASEARIKVLSTQLTDVKNHLRSRRTALAGIRREILRRLHESGGVFSGAPSSGNAPPTYMRLPEVGSRTIHPTSVPEAPSRHSTAESVQESQGGVAPPDYEARPVSRNKSPSPSRSPLPPRSSPTPSSSFSATPTATSTSNLTSFAPPPGPPPGSGHTRARSLAGTPADGVGGFIDPRVAAARSRSHSPSPSSPSSSSVPRSSFPLPRGGNANVGPDVRPTSSISFERPSLNMPVPNISFTNASQPSLVTSPGSGSPHRMPSSPRLASRTSSTSSTTQDHGYNYEQAPESHVNSHRTNPFLELSSTPGRLQTFTTGESQNSDTEGRRSASHNPFFSTQVQYTTSHQTQRGDVH